MAVWCGRLWVNTYFCVFCYVVVVRRNSAFTIMHTENQPTDGGIFFYTL